MISSEDDLFSYIRSRICSEFEYSSLLQFIRFEYVSSECISHFLSTLPDSIDRRLWESVSGRLISPVPTVSDSKSLAEDEFPLKAPGSREGINSYLTRKHGGNVHDKGIVTITSKSVDEDRAKNFSFLAELTCHRQFGSDDKPGQWVCWDFHERCIRPTHYTIIFGHTLTSWVVESSLDFVNWTEIDRKTHNSDLKKVGTASFAVSNPAEGRFIRLTQTGPNHFGTDRINMSAIEFFGTLIEGQD
jgi:hypothetical protein